MRSKSFKTLSYSVFYEQALEGGYAAFIPTLPGTQDDSLEEPDRNVEEAITLYLDRLPSNGEAAPSPLRPTQVYAPSLIALDVIRALAQRKPPDIDSPFTQGLNRGACSHRPDH
jgi:predicted RNase H-like HicB family nuclease